MTKSPETTIWARLTAPFRQAWAEAKMADEVFMAITRGEAVKDDESIRLLQRAGLIRKEREGNNG